LLEFLPAGIFGVTLGNLPPHTDVHVDFVYHGELKHDAAVDGLRFMLPTSIAPRYGDYPGELLDSIAVSDGGISIVVDVDMDTSAIRKLQSPSHPIAVAMGATSLEEDAQAAFTASKASASLTFGTTELANDFVLQLLIDDISKPQALVEKHPSLPTRAIMTTLVPKFNLETSYPEIVFIADQSGSMQGAKNDALVSALTVFIKSMPMGVRFNICAFGNSYKTLWRKSQAYNEDNVKAAIAFVQTFAADYGGTKLQAPVQAAFENMLGDMPLEVMILTDGEIWGEQVLFDYINQQIVGEGADARVFALGIGGDVSHTLVEGVAKAGNGFAQFVTPGEGTDQKVIRMLKAALYPHLTNRTMEVQYHSDKEGATVKYNDFELVEKVDYCLNISDLPAATDGTEKTTKDTTMSFYDSKADLDTSIQPAGTDQYAHLPTFDTPKILQAPTGIPTLYPFNRTTIYLILGPDAPQMRVSSITLRATSPQGPFELTIGVNEKDSGTTIHQLAARRAVQELEEGRGWLQGAKTSSGSMIKEVHASRFEELVEREAVRLGESFQVAGKWTSFVAVQADGSRSVENQPTQPPQVDAAFGSHRRKMASMSMRAGSSKRSVKCFSISMEGSSTPPIAPGGRSWGENRKAGARGASRPLVQAQYQPSLKSFGPGSTQPSWQPPPMRVNAQVMPLAQAYGAPPVVNSDGTTVLAGSLPPTSVFAPTSVQALAPEEEAEESDDDMGFGLWDSASSPGAPQPINLLHVLIGLQTFVGAWEWNEDLFAVITLGKKPVFDAGFRSEQVMATALAIAYLETRLADSKGVWEMVVAKARAWVGAQIGAEAVEGLVGKAGGLLRGGTPTQYDRVGVEEG
jgi:hypothetical protein